MNDCTCGCSDLTKGSICETMPKCVSNVRVFVGDAYANQKVKLLFIRHSPRQKCKKIEVVVDVDGYATIAAIDSFPNDFFFKGWTINYKYEFSAEDLVGEKIELTYKTNKYCSLVFFISACDGSVTHLINKL